MAAKKKAGSPCVPSISETHKHFYKQLKGEVEVDGERREGRIGGRGVDKGRGGRQGRQQGARETRGKDMREGRRENVGRWTGETRREC